MALNYAKLFNRRITPQSQPIPGSTQVANSAGGYSWEVDDWTRLDRFLILGAEGGTYYIGERDLVKQNHDAIVRCIKADGVRAVNRIVEISDSGRAPKNDPAIFALALVATHGSPEAKGLALQNLAKVCRIGTHLFHFAEYVNALRGWGRGLRNAVGKGAHGADAAAHFDEEPFDDVGRAQPFPVGLGAIEEGSSSSRSVSRPATALGCQAAWARCERVFEPLFRWSQRHCVHAPRSPKATLALPTCADRRHLSHSFPCRKEVFQPTIISQDPVDHSPGRAHDLAGQQHDGVQKAPKLPLD
jgi:hypothetical protein